MTVTPNSAAIRYTTDGSTPTQTNGTLYSAPVVITSNCTLKAIGYESGMSDSQVTTASYAIIPKIAGFNFAFAQGNFWTYGWTITTSSWQAGLNPSTTTSTGSGTVTLGAPVTIQGVQAFPILLTGTFPTSFSPGWKYLAIADSRILGSVDGTTLQDVFNAWTGSNAGGGFFSTYPTATITTAYPYSMSTTYYSNAQTYVLGKSSSTSSSQYFPGIGTISTGNPDTSVAQKEFFAPGTGPVGLTISYGYSTTDFMSSTTGQIGLTASSFSQTQQGGSVTGVTVSPTSATLVVDGTQQLTATLLPGNATNQNVTWSSNDPQVASVSSTGLIGAVTAGTATVTVTTADGGKTATCAVRVYPTPYPEYSSSYIGTMKGVVGGTFQRDNASTDVSTVSSFHMSQNLITGAQFAAVTGVADPSYFTYSGHPADTVNWYAALVFCNDLSIKEGLTPVYTIAGSTNPASWGAVPAGTNSTWDAVTININANGYRLPTEAEYLWAMMGGMSDSRPGDIVGTVNTGGISKAFSGSNGSNSVDSYAWTADNASGSSHAGGTLRPNELGISDLSGNLFEWNWDWYGSLPSGALSNYTGPASGTQRYILGGSWYTTPAYCAVSPQYYNYPYALYHNIGFRVVAR